MNFTEIFIKHFPFKITSFIFIGIATSPLFGMKNSSNTMVIAQDKHICIGTVPHVYKKDLSNLDDLYDLLPYKLLLVPVILSSPNREVSVYLSLEQLMNKDYSFLNDGNQVTSYKSLFTCTNGFKKCLIEKLEKFTDETNIEILHKQSTKNNPMPKKIIQISQLINNDIILSQANQEGTTYRNSQRVNSFIKDVLAVNNSVSIQEKYTEKANNPKFSIWNMMVNNPKLSIALILGITATTRLLWHISYDIYKTTRSITSIILTIYSTLISSN